MIRRPPRSTLFPSTPLSRSRLSPLLRLRHRDLPARPPPLSPRHRTRRRGGGGGAPRRVIQRSEEHTSELQSLAYLVCRLLLEKKKGKAMNQTGAWASTIPPS